MGSFFEKIKQAKAKEEKETTIDFSETNAKLNSGYMEASAYIEIAQEKIEKQLCLAHGWPAGVMLDFIKKQYRSFREIQDTVNIFDKRALKIVEKLQKGTISKKEAKIQIKSLLDRWMQRLEAKGKEWIEAEQNRSKCQQALRSQFDAEFLKAKQLFRMHWAGHKTFDADRVDYLCEAYFRRWYVGYQKSIGKLKPDKVKMLSENITSEGFISGNIKKDLDNAYKEIAKAIELWQKNGKNTTSTFKKQRWDGFEIRFDRWEIDGNEVRVGPLPDGSAFEKERKKDFPSGAKHLAASLKPKPKPKPKTLVQKAKAKATRTAKRVVSGASSLISWAGSKLKRGASVSKDKLRSATKEANKIRKKLQEQLKSGTVEAGAAIKAARKKLEQLRRDTNYTEDIKDAYRATLRKATQLKNEAAEKAKAAGGKAKEGYEKGAEEIGKLTADAQAEMKKAKKRVDIKKIKDKLENSISAIAKRLGLSSKPSAELEKEATLKVGKEAYAKIKYLKEQLNKRRGGVSHKKAMLLSSKYRIAFNKIQRATNEYNEAMNEVDVAKRKAKLTALNNQIDKEAKANDISFPKSIFAGIAGVAAKPKAAPKATPKPKAKPTSPEVSDDVLFEKKVEHKVKYLEKEYQKRKSDIPEMYRSMVEDKIKSVKDDYNSALNEKDPAKRKQKFEALDKKIDGLISMANSAGVKLTIPPYKAPKKVTPRTAPKPAPSSTPRTPETTGAAPKISKIEFKKEGQIDITGENLPAGSIKLNVSRLRADLLNNIKWNTADVSKLTFSRDNMNQKIAESILNGIDDKKLRLAIAGKLKDKPEELINLLKLSDTPTIQVVGRASMDGGFAHNQQLAMRRAKSAIARIEALNPGIGQVVDFKPVGEVVDVNGRKISDINKAWRGFAASWNLEFQENLTVAQMKAIVRRYVAYPTTIRNAEQKQFLFNKLDHVRGVQLHVVKPAKAPNQITVNMKNK